MDKVYQHKHTEEKWYAFWEKGGYFKPSNDPEKRPFTIIMPPPNANDPLHIGHVMFITVEDIMTRYHRMRGDATLWLPGTDHAGIETQFVFEKKLKKEGKSRFDFDRTTLYKMIWDYVQENSGIAVDQMKRLGASPDWDRFKFTLDSDIVTLVLETFQKLHTEGLIYRDYRLVNYCTRCGTGFSELEVKHEVRKDSLLYIKYGQFTIATVRPETKFRDTALAVNPGDKRYKQHIGKTYEIPGLLGPIVMTVITDPEVDPKFGTGIMKVTPAHDFHDYDLGKKYNLPITPIIDFKGKMDFSWFINDPKFSNLPSEYKDRAHQYNGLHVSKARLLMTKHLKQDGLLVKIDENYEHTVTLCYRCNSLLEPLPLAQFFIKVKPLAEKVLKSLKEKEVKIHGPGYEKILVHWLKNLKDWNISRQIVWGIRQPVWYSLKDNPTLQVTYLKSDGQQVLRSGEGVLKTNELDEAKNGLQQLQAPISAKYVISHISPGPEYLQETDTFDTWFSSGQWPVVALKTTKPGDFGRFYPTQVMETAYDILIFWVMRMLLFGIFLTGKVPFKHVYLHGLVRDEKRQKMSKSKGNVINPLDIVEKYGADALRFALIFGSTPGHDLSLSEEKIRGMRNFTNKLWNIGRFIQLHMNRFKEKGILISDIVDSDKREKMHAKDKKILTQSILLQNGVTSKMESFRFGLAAETLYEFIWHELADRYIEESKERLENYNCMTFSVLFSVFKTCLTLLHPFMPFITEEITEQLSKGKSLPLIISPWSTVK